MRAARAIWWAAIAPAIAYFLIFHTFKCETVIQQFIGVGLGIAGFLIAVATGFR